MKFEIFLYLMIVFSLGSGLYVGFNEGRTYQDKISYTQGFHQGHKCNNTYLTLKESMYCLDTILNLGE